MEIPQTGQGRENGSDDGAITPQQLIAELMTAIHNCGHLPSSAAVLAVIANSGSHCLTTTAR